jgi:hypothetical protein
MALARLRSMEALRHYAPGEWGKLLGIERAPKVRILRIKLKHLADQAQAFAWSAKLCQEWMMEGPDEAAVLYIDGHVRVYHGRTKQLPKWGDHRRTPAKPGIVQSSPISLSPNKTAAHEQPESLHYP